MMSQDIVDEVRQEVCKLTDSNQNIDDFIQSNIIWFGRVAAIYEVIKEKKEELLSKHLISEDKLVLLSQRYIETVAFEKVLRHIERKDEFSQIKEELKNIDDENVVKKILQAVIIKVYGENAFHLIHSMNDAKIFSDHSNIPLSEIIKMK